MDLIDRKLLCELDLDCRMPISQIARKLRIGRNVVDYRVRKLEREGFIQQYISTINLGLLGYTIYKVYFKVHQTRENKKFIEVFLKDKRVLHCIKTEGYFDYVLAIAVKSIYELDDFLMEIRNEFIDIIRDCNVSALLYTKIFTLGKLLLNNPEHSLTRKFSISDERVIIDDKDKRILNILSQSAKISLIEISEKVGISIDITKYRLKKLKRNIIISNRAIFDMSKLGYHHYVIMLKMKQITKNNEEKLGIWCAQNKSVLYYGKRIGYFDFELNIAIQNIEDLNSFLLSLKKDFGEFIDLYEVVLNTKLLKLNYLPF